jgi:hypothetical protein
MVLGECLRLFFAIQQSVSPKVLEFYGMLSRFSFLIDVKRWNVPKSCNVRFPEGYHDGLGFAAANRSGGA